MSNKHLNGYVDENDDDIYPETHYPTCRFCGKSTIPTARYDSDADADEAATMACDCYDARQYREQKAQAEQREKNIAKLKSSINAIQDYCTDFAHLLQMRALRLSTVLSGRRLLSFRG